MRIVPRRLRAGWAQRWRRGRQAEQTGRSEWYASSGLPLVDPADVSAAPSWENRRNHVMQSFCSSRLRIVPGIFKINPTTGCSDKSQKRRRLLRMESMTRTWSIWRVVGAYLTKWHRQYERNSVKGCDFGATDDCRLSTRLRDFPHTPNCAVSGVLIYLNGQAPVDRGSRAKYDLYRTFARRSFRRCHNRFVPPVSTSCRRWRARREHQQFWSSTCRE